MSVLDDLIRIKSNKQEDDLLKLLDEIPVYEKLSVNESFRDLKTSVAARAKCPKLAAFIDGKMYETILADIASNVYLQIEGEIPNILQTVTDKNQKQQKQMEILQNGIIRVEYRDLMEYDHASMEKFLAAVFVKPLENATIAVLIVKNTDSYIMYHGIYTTNEEDKVVGKTLKPLSVKGQYGIFAMNSYSVLGNNGYRFGSYTNNHTRYDVMIGPDGILYLMNGNSTALQHIISAEEKNNLNMVNKDPERFAELVTSIIESVVRT